MLLNSKIRYGIKALFFLTEAGENVMFTAAEISERLNVPKEFISKIMQSLTYEGILSSKKGKGGGFFLAVNPSELSFERVFKVLGYDENISECIFDMKDACKRNTCPFCNDWKSFLLEFNETLRNYSIKGNEINK
ncbi:BadM/Rrf2 family transcriptional regulator [Melioribacter roseus P3M-2]|jgi:Rrf2 family protein|uniref:BadM/Rrf2 family transcriptional regulator n=1 Tax=Melioribacter roseus (strain DSM 23840 / JCM 17771 / VKM B-2668 / P3M-2) TaxID=1191523 RepID=I6Z5A9_MELRP|nr:Rrf2 family transcriptional regulator [Melioribacter roseus]AFN74340.1 BadM/Rrf2 family transcriptional regulator [Melioribacter roseus P3M-2]